MIESILTSIKKTLGLDASYTAFDEDIILHINSAFSDLSQIGVGPEAGFMIEDATEVWSDFIITDALLLNNIRSYMYLRVKMLFDPPERPEVIQAFKEQIQQFEWRINVTREQTAWTAPV